MCTVDRAPEIVLVSAPGYAHGWAPLNVARLKAALIATGRVTHSLFLCVEWSDEVRHRYPALLALDKEIGEFGHAWHELHFAARLFGHDTPRGLIRATLFERACNLDIHATGFAPGPGEPDAPPPPSRATLAVQTRRIAQYCERLERFLLRCLDRIDWDGVRVVGFSCVEAQFLTSVFLARQIKARRPHVRVVFGGPFLQPHNAAPFAECFPEIDHVVVGEGETALPTLLQAFDEGAPSPPRVMVRLAAPFAGDPIGRGSERLGGYPAPDYTDVPPRALGHTALTTYMGKGCSHWRCSFCAINERGQQVRPAAVVFEEIRHLVERHGTTNISFGDWEINGDPARLEELCDLLIAAGLRLDAWAEINARNTSRPLLAKMARAGIANVQIGVESFSPNVLRHIHKPATQLDNVKVLKWGIEAGMSSIFFNVLCNHPKSTQEDVQINARAMRAIAHLLRPPVDMVLNEMDLYRTSDLFERAERYGIEEIGDYQWYRRCYPEERLGARLPMFNLSYRRHRVDPSWVEVSEFLRALRRRPVTLSLRRVRGGVAVYDSRGGTARLHHVDGLAAEVLCQAGEGIGTPAELAEVLGAAASDVSAALARLAEGELVIEDRGRFLGLPISLAARRALRHESTRPRSSSKSAPEAAMRPDGPARLPAS